MRRRRSDRSSRTCTGKPVRIACSSRRIGPRRDRRTREGNRRSADSRDGVDRISTHSRPIPGDRRTACIDRRKASRATYSLIRKAARKMALHGTFDYSNQQIPDAELCAFFPGTPIPDLRSPRTVSRPTCLDRSDRAKRCRHYLAGRSPGLEHQPDCTRLATPASVDR